MCLLYAPHMIALAALYIICVVHAERYVENNNTNISLNNNTSSPLSNNLNDDSPGGIVSHSHSNIHLHSQLHSMATKKSGQQNSNIPNTEGHGINNRNMVQWFADLNVEIEEVRPPPPGRFLLPCLQTSFWVRVEITNLGDIFGSILVDY